MNADVIKAFLKIERRKVLLTGAMFILTTLLHGIAFKSESVFLKGLEILLSPHYLLYRVIMSIRSPPPGILGDITFTSVDILLMSTIFIIGVLYWYSLSCLMAFFYDKCMRRMPVEYKSKELKKHG